jgi:branched-chain amino acid transport system ATP-binding protein
MTLAQPMVETAVQTVLAVSNVSVKFGELWACRDLNFEIQSQEVLGVIGPNGAGKTSLVNAITGAYPVQKGGDITFTDVDGRDHDLIGKSTVSIAKLGVVRTFQNLGLVSELSVFENLALGADIHESYGPLASLLKSPRARRSESRTTTRAHEMLERLQLSQYSGELPEDIPYGIRKRVDLGRVLLMRPRLLILDEPLAGMAADERVAMLNIIEEIKGEFSLAMIFIEHDVKSVMHASDRVLALAAGSVLMLDSPEAVHSDQRVRDAYLGRDADDIDV